MGDAGGRPSSSSGPAVGAGRPVVHYYVRSRRWSVIPLAVATVLLAISIGGPWWQTTLNENTQAGTVLQDVNITFSLPDRVSCSQLNWTSSPTPCAALTPATVRGGTGVLYELTDYALAALVVVGGAAVALGVIANRGERRDRRSLHLWITLVLVVAVASLAMVAASTAVGPGPEGSATCNYLSGGNSSCPTFWGSAAAAPIPGGCALCNNSLSWGAGNSYYFTLIGGVIFLSVGALLGVTRKRPFTLEEQRAWATRYRPIPASPGRSGPPDLATVSAASILPPPTTVPEATVAPAAPRPAIGRYTPSKTPWTCARCGTENSAWANLCRACNADRPAEGS
jgi:hypothetical protein